MLRYHKGHVTFGGSLGSGTGSLARVTPLFLCGFDVVFVLFNVCMRYESADVKLRFAKKTHPKNFSPCGTESLVRVAQNPVVAMGVYRNISPTIDVGSAAVHPMGHSFATWATHQKPMAPMEDPWEAHRGRMDTYGTHMGHPWAIYELSQRFESMGDPWSIHQSAVKTHG